MRLHVFLDTQYGSDGDAQLEQHLRAGADVHSLFAGESPLHVATRRCRLQAVKLLLRHGANINARNAHGKTAYTHAIRREFGEIVALLSLRGADQSLAPADQFAVFMTTGKLDAARSLLKKYPEIIRTGNPAEDRLLADLAGRAASEPLELLIGAGADLAAPGLDEGTPLHQSAWFGQPQNARLLIDAGAPLDHFEPVHQASPLHWAVHGSQYSGGAPERVAAYAELVQMLLDAGSSLHYPDEPGSDAYLRRLHADAPAAIKSLLPAL